MSELLNDLKKKLNHLDCSQSTIQSASEEFVNLALSDEMMMEDLVKLWKFYAISKNDKLSFIFLANDIIQNSFFRKLKLHEIFFNHLVEVFPTLCNSLNDKLKKEIYRVLEIWEERKIFDSSKLDNLRQLLSVYTIPHDDTLVNPLFQSFIKNNKIQISDKIKEMAINLEEKSKLEEKIQYQISNKIKEMVKKLKESKNLEESKILGEKIKIYENSQNLGEIKNLEESENLQEKLEEKIKNFEEIKNSEDIKRSLELLNITRGKFLRNAAEITKKQNQAYFKHVYYLQEVEKMLDKISQNKKVNENQMQVDE